MTLNAIVCRLCGRWLWAVFLMIFRPLSTHVILVRRLSAMFGVFDKV